MGPQPARDRSLTDAPALNRVPDHQPVSAARGPSPGGNDRTLGSQAAQYHHGAGTTVKNTATRSQVTVKGLIRLSGLMQVCRPKALAADPELPALGHHLFLKETTCPSTRADPATAALTSECRMGPLTQVKLQVRGHGRGAHRSAG